MFDDMVPWPAPETVEERDPAECVYYLFQENRRMFHILVDIDLDGRHVRLDEAQKESLLKRGLILPNGDIHPRTHEAIRICERLHRRIGQVDPDGLRPRTMIYEDEE